MLSKESKIRVLENFKTVDYIFFGKPITKMDTCCEALVQEYVTIKGALTSVLIEMYGLINHTPEVMTETVGVSDLVKSAKKNAIVARENAQKLVMTEKGRATIKSEISKTLSENKDLNIEEEVKDSIRKKAFSLALDNSLIARSLQESVDSKKLNSWEGQLVEDAYKALRDQLVESAFFIIEASTLTA